MATIDKREAIRKTASGAGATKSKNIGTRTAGTINKNTGERTAGKTTAMQVKPISKAAFQAGAKADAKIGALAKKVNSTAMKGAVKSKVGNASKGTAKPIGRATTATATKTPLHSGNAGNKMQEYYNMRKK